MNAVLREEIRLLIPAWVVALAAATMPAWAKGDVGLIEDISFILFAAGALFLSLSPFGLEMSLGTFSSLLAQPRPRLNTWRIKIRLLALAFASVVVAAGVSWFSLCRGVTNASAIRSDHIFYILILAVLAFVGGLWTTLLLRQIASAFWFSILVPLVLFCRPSEDDNSSFARVALAVGICAYGVAGYWLARWLFLNAQDKQAQEAAERGAWSFLPAFPQRRWRLTALFVKELRLQQGTLLIAVVMLLLHLLALAVSEYSLGWNSASFDLSGFWLLWMLMPLVAGCASIAEERRNRTLDGALCLPVGKVLQFAIKLLVVFALGILLGAVMPFFLEHLRFVTRFDVASFKRLVIAATLITALGCYVSSLTAALLPAIGAAIGLFTTLFVVTLYISDGQPFGSEDYPFPWFFLFATSICLSYANFKQVRITWRQLFRNGIIFSAGAAIFLSILAAGASFGFFDLIRLVMFALCVILAAVLIYSLLQRRNRLT